MKAMNILFILLAIAVVGALVVCFYFLVASSVPNPHLPARMLKVGDAQFTVEVANTTTTRMRGLSGRDPLKEGEGMLFIFDKPSRYGFWMKDMKFALDFVWVSGDKVVGVTENVPPPASGTSMFSLPVYYPPENVDKILELNAGEVKRYGIRTEQSAILTP